MKTRKKIKKLAAKVKKLERRLEPKVKHIGFNYLHHDDNEYDELTYKTINHKP